MRDNGSDVKSLKLKDLYDIRSLLIIICVFFRRREKYLEIRFV